MGKGAFTGVIHCFTASQDFAHKALELGLFISISGIVTFKNARDLQDTASRLPGERLLIETDAPFLAPVPKRGKPCEPAFVTHTAQIGRAPGRERVGQYGEISWFDGPLKKTKPTVKRRYNNYWTNAHDKMRRRGQAS